MDLRRELARPGGERRVNRFPIAHTNGVMAVVVKDVPDHAQSRAGRELRHVVSAKRAVIVLDHEPPPGRLTQPLEAAEKAIARGLDPTGSSAHV